MPQEPKIGDTVKITTRDGEFEGTLLPRSALLSNDINVLKLESGYNIGVDAKKIKKTQLVKKNEQKKPANPKLKKRKDLPTVAILSTGGTISSRVDYRTGAVHADYSAEDFVAMCPELQEIANIEAKQVLSVMSEDVVAGDWNEMAKAVEKILPKVDGVVITHGTDTMHVTSAALSFLLKDVSKPVVITGAQRSIDRGSSDAFMNLTCAVNAAANWGGAGVVTCMHGTSSDDYCLLINGTKVRKMHASKRDAFRPINAMPLAKVFYDVKKPIEPLSDYPKRGKLKLSLRKLDANEKHVALVHVYPNMDPNIIDYYVKTGVKAIVLVGTGLGHAPQGDHDAGTLLRNAVKKGIQVFMTTQTLYGRVHPHVYTNLRRLSQHGIIFLEDMLPETAYVKCMVALKEKDPKTFMVTNIAGEITIKESKGSFLR